CADAAAALIDAAGRGARGALPARVAGHHGHDAAGRRRPAPLPPAARRHVSRPGAGNAEGPLMDDLVSPPLLDCRRLFLRDYEVWINIGVHDFEKHGEQRVLINVDLYIPLALSTPQHDDLEEVVDYDFIRRTIALRVKQGHIHLQETLCDDILRLMLAHPR